LIRWMGLFNKIKFNFGIVNNSKILRLHFLMNSFFFVKLIFFFRVVLLRNFFFNLYSNHIFRLFYGLFRRTNFNWRKIFRRNWSYAFGEFFFFDMWWKRFFLNSSVFLISIFEARRNVFLVLRDSFVS